MQNKARSLLILALVALGALPLHAQTATPETAAQREARMAWWREAKFGMFIHWGVYAVPAGFYKGQPVGGIGEWIMCNGKIPMADYQKYAKEFNPVKFNADEWVKLAKDAGQKYIVITAKHHDGFAMFGSKAGDWNLMQASPFHRDPLKELAAACRKHGIKLGFYYSQAQDWINGGSACSGKWDPAQQHSMDEYIDKVAVPQVKEILTGYGEFPAVLWWDTPCDMNADRAAKLAELLKLKPGIITNNRLGGGYDGDTETPEQTIPATGFKGRDWETCMTMNDTWGFKSDDHNWKPTTTLLRNLVDIVSKGGNYLLNVGPTAEGLIPPPSIERLRAVGAWMKANGDAIYGTHASPFKKLPFNGRCTQKPGKLFLHVFERPADGKLVVPLTNPITKAYLLAAPRTPLTVTDQTIELPGQLADPMDTVIVAEITGEPAVLATSSAISPAVDGAFTLSAADAEITGSAQLENQGGAPNIGYWTEANTTVQWTLNVTQPGTFTVALTYACEPGSDNSEYDIIAGAAKVSGKIAATQNWGDFTTVNVGKLNLTPAGKLSLIVKPTSKPGMAVMNLRQLKLTPQ